MGVNVWVSWCGPCWEAAPLLRERSERPTGGTGLPVIGLLVQETQGQNARDVLLEVVLGSRRDPNLRAVIHSGVGGMPEPFLLDCQDVGRGADA